MSLLWVECQKSSYVCSADLTSITSHDQMPLPSTCAAFIWTSKWHHAWGICHLDVRSDVVRHWWCTKTTLVMHLDTVSKPATGFEASTRGPDTQLFKKITHAYTHIRTDSVTSSPLCFLTTSATLSYKAPYKIKTNMLYMNSGININNITVH